MEYILEIEKLEYCYPDGTQALRGINCKIEKGKKIAVVGVNGSGKSTLFLCLNGVLPVKHGSIKFQGEEIRYDKKSLMKLRQKLGIVFQNPETMLFSSNVYQEVSFGPMNLNLPKEEVESLVQSSLTEVNMWDYREKAVHFLSYGQKKRVSIADILAMRPELMILDEPSSSLDPKHARQLMELLEQLHQKGITVILSTHDVNLAYAWADEVIAMKDGNILMQGETIKVFSEKEILEACYLEQPHVLQMYYALLEKQLIEKDGKFPRNEKELLASLDQIKIGKGKSEREK